MNYEDKFVRAEASGNESIFTRIDETHPIEIFLGLERGQRAVLVVCPERPPDPPSLGSIQVDVRPRPTGEWALILRLARPDLKALFVRLIEDLATATRHGPQNPGSVVISRLSRWQRLLSRGETGTLEDHELRGLAAELDFLIGEAIMAVGPRAAVEAWVGPYDAPRDFNFGNVEVEVKSVHRQQRSIHISSLEQLTDASSPLYLWSRVVDLGTAEPSSINSIAALVARVRDAVSNDAVASEALDDRLWMAGYRDKPEYQQRTVLLGPSACFRVVREFPRIQRSQVSAAVESCRYEIVAASLEPYRVDTWREAQADGR